MLKIFYSIILISLFFITKNSLYAEERRYVSDNLSAWIRSGPGDNYRLIGTVNAGDEVTLLQVNNDGNYGQIRDANGRTAWIQLKELSVQASLRTRVPDLEKQVKMLTNKLNNIDSVWNQRTNEIQKKVAQSDYMIINLKKENQKLKDKLIIAQKEMNILNHQLDDKKRAIIVQWFMYGGGVLGIGLILGLALPHIIPNRKHRDRWMN